LRDGTLLCSFFTYWGEPENGDWGKDPSLAVRVHLIRSFDGGRTWEKKSRQLQTPFLYDETDGPLVRLKDGSVLIAINGRARTGPPDQAAVLRSTNRGRSWKLLATIKAGHDLQEVTVAELPDGRLVMMARPEGDICWSRDHGRAWTPPMTFGMRMFAPSLYVLRDGTLVCLHGSYAPGHGGLRVIFSTDGGHTWIAPANDHGFLVDNSYGYGKAIELTDGSLFITYLSSGGHRTQDAQSNSIRCIGLRLRPDHSGVELLPAPNRWRSRFDKEGRLRPATRAQMHFIGRAMAGKGWLDPALLPGTDSLQVEIRGPARALLFPDGAGEEARSTAGVAPSDSGIRVPRDPRDSH